MAEGRLLDFGVIYAASCHPLMNPAPPGLLRESYRENGKVKKRTLLNLSVFPDEVIDILRAALTLAKNTILLLPHDKHPVTIHRLTTPTPIQKEAFRLLASSP